MGDPLPHDERIGQVIYNALRPDEDGTDKDVNYLIFQTKAAIADKLFNIPDHKLKAIFFERLWCDKCKSREF